MVTEATYDELTRGGRGDEVRGKKDRPTGRIRQSESRTRSDRSDRFGCSLQLEMGWYEII